MIENVGAYLKGLINVDLGPGALFGLLVLVFLLLYGLSLGRTRALISLLAIYIAYALQSVFPYFENLQDVIVFSPFPYFIRIAFFLIFYAVVFVVLNRSLVKHRMSMKEFSVFWVSLVSVLQLGILISVVLSFIPSGELTIFSPALMGLFAGTTALFFWFLAPVILLVFMRRR